MVKLEDNLHQRLLTARLPALPQALLRFLELCRREEAGLDEVGRLIAQEPAMATKVLNLSGSASRYQLQPARNLLHSLMQIGLDSAKTALVAESVHQVFDAFVAGRTVDLGHFWQHSLTAAILARRLAKESGYARAEEAYLAGLLHDVGQLAMMATLPDQYFTAFAEDQDDGWLANWELLALGLTHAEVGAWLAGRWRLDSYLADALLYHHEPAERLVSAHPLVRITWLAHSLARDPQVDVAVFGLNPQTIQRIQEGVDDEVQKAARFLGVDLGREGAEATARTQLAEVVRTMALVGAQREVRISPAADFLPRLQAVMTAARSLYGFGDGILFLPAASRLRGRVAWPHLARLEELDVPVGPEGGCVGIAAESGRPTTSWDAGPTISILDEQLRRALDGEGLLCLPLAAGGPAAVLAFALDRKKADALRAAPLLLENFVNEAAAALEIGKSEAAVETNVSRDQLRRAIHEANNPLGIIKNYLHILGERLAGQDEAADIALLNAEIDRVSRILNNLTAPAERQQGQPSRGYDLNRTVRELVAFCKDTGFVPPGIRLELSLADDLPEVRANPDQLKQILLNLVRNSVEVLGSRGKIGITSSGPVLHAGESHVLLRVFDDGPGLPAEVRERVFQPVATRKGGQHAGLGLAIVGELVAKLRGRIECRSSDMGTVFEILLPADSHPEEAM